MSAGGGSKKVIVFALLANLGIAIAKFTGAFISGSAALLAEAIHSLVDCANQVLLLVGSKLAKRAPTELHPLGYGREAFFWSFVVAILLFSLGGVFAIYEGAHKLSEHGEVSAPFLSMGILAVSIVLEGMSFWACIKEVRSQNPYKNLWVWFRKTTASELLVIFTEDAAAMVGLILAFLCVFVSWLTGNVVWDALGSIFVGSLLVVVAALLAIEVKSLLIGEAPSTDFRGFIEGKVSEYIPGGKVFNLIALQIGANEVMLSCKLSAGNVKDVSQLIGAINQIEREVKQKFPEVRWQFMEPDDAD
jgi:cation diffusion facilitator family transporter